jgi:dienelactone hydrolase
MTAPKRRRLVRRLLGSVAVVMALGVLGVAALLASLAVEHRTGVALPTPTGPFAVGRVLFDWVDPQTPDALAPVAGARRELLVWMWYPAAAGRSAAVDDYLPTLLRAAREATDPTIIKLLRTDLSKVHAHSIRAADVSPRQRSYPVVIMRAGASAEVASYSTLAEDLASHGYVVVGFDAPYRTQVVAFPDGRVMRRMPENNPELCLGMTGQERDRCVSRLLTAWTADTAFVLDRLERLNGQGASGIFPGRLDMTRVGVFGHSFGGATALQFCHEDPRCKAGIDVDGAPHGSVIRAGVDRPFMFLLSDHSRESDPESRQIKADIQSIYDRLPVDGRVRVAIRGSNHFLFSDDGVLRSRIVLRTLRVFGLVGIDGRRQLAVAAYCVRSFFDAYLKGSGASSFELSSPAYPEIQALD